MKTNHFYLLIILFSFIVVTFLYFSSLIDQKNLLKITEKLKSKNNSLEHSQKVIQDMMFGQGQLISVNFNNAINGTDSNKQLKNIQEIIGKKKIVFRFDENNCFSCVEKFFPFLRILSKETDKNVVILGSYYNPENLFAQLERFHLDLPIYNIAPDNLINMNSRIMNANVPFVFELDSALKTSNFFIPEKGLPDLSTAYCKMILNNF